MYIPSNPEIFSKSHYPSDESLILYSKLLENLNPLESDL